MEEATHPSTALSPVRGDMARIPNLEEKELSPRKGRQAGEVRVTGCAQKRVAENRCHIVAVGKYVMLEDDVVPHQKETRSVFMCANRGKVYNEMINDKRRSRMGCWAEIAGGERMERGPQISLATCNQKWTKLGNGMKRIGYCENRCAGIRHQ